MPPKSQRLFPNRKSKHYDLESKDFGNPNTPTESPKNVFIRKRKAYVNILKLNLQLSLVLTITRGTQSAVH